MPWFNHALTGLHYKTMAYQQSCFPCSLHIVLANLGHAPHNGDGMEDLWNNMQTARNPAGNLNRNAPTEMEVHENIANTPVLGNRGVIFTPAMFQVQADAHAILNRVNAEFIHSAVPVGMIFGIGHAEVFYNPANGGFVHLHTAPDQNNIAITPYGTLNAAVAGQGNDFAVVLSSGGQNILAGNFIMIIR